METAMESEYESPMEDVEPYEDIFLGFSPERENHPSELESYITELESNIAKMKDLFCKLAETPENLIKPEPIPEVNEEIVKPVENVSEVRVEEADIEKPVIKEMEVEMVNQPEPEKPDDTNNFEETLKPESNPTVGCMLPFFKGWKREVNLKEKEICYIHPLGTRLKNIHDVSQQLTDGLSIDNFTFELKALGASPEFEVVTHTVRKSGRVPIPSSNYKIAERLEEESRKRVVENNGPVAPVKHGKLVLKLKSKRPENRENGERGPKKKSSLSRKSSHFRRNWIAEKVEEEPRRNCTLKCPMAMGLIPSLQCCVCLCLYHPECAEVGRTGSTKQIHAYVCKSCRAKPENRKPGEPAPVLPATQRAITAPVLPQPPPPPVIAQSHSIPPQHIITLNRRRFVMVPNYLPTSPAGAPLPASNNELTTNTSPVPSIKPEVVKKSPEKNQVENLGPNLASLVCRGYTALLQIFKKLSIEELGRLAQVCVLYRDLAQHPSLWERVELNKSVNNWEAFCEVLRKRGTRSLDLRNISLPPDNELTPLSRLKTLEKIYFPQISLEFLQLLLNSESNIRECYSVIAISPGDERLVFSAPRLEILNLRYVNPPLRPLKSLEIGSCATNLNSLSLLSFTICQSIDFSSLKQLKKLKVLELGDCAKIPVSFCEVLTELTELTSIRLEVGGSTWPMVEILQALRTLPNLIKLELIHFDCPPGFESALANMKNVQRLLIIPLFEFQMAAKVNALLSAIYQLKDNLVEMCWVFLIELLQVSELFINRMPIRRAYGGLDSCVPVMLPLPLPEDTSEHAEFWSEISQLESPHNYVPITLGKIQSMFDNALPKTKTQLVVLPRAATSRKSLEELLI